MIKRTLHIVRWPYALAVALYACSVPALRCDSRASASDIVAPDAGVEGGLP